MDNPTPEALDALKDRVTQFRAMKLPGQPMAMHMGTAYLVGDLDEAIRALRARLAEVEAQLATAQAERDAALASLHRRNAVIEATGQVAATAAAAAPITEQDVRLIAGEGALSLTTTVRAVNAILARRAGNPPPTPEAVARAALEWAAEECNRVAYSKGFAQDDKIELGCLRCRDYIRAGDFNPATIAAIIAKAEGGE